MSRQTFAGQDALYKYLRPDAELYTPLVELPPSLNPFYHSHGVHIYIKLLNTLPLANVKSLPAWNMLESLPAATYTTVVESSSGNTVFSLGILARLFGVDTVQAIASRDVSQGKLDLLRLAGVHVQLVDGPLCPSPNDPKSSINKARQLGDQPGWINPGQYDNAANPDAHLHYTGPQIHSQLEGDIAMFAAGLGTTGTLVGTAKYLRNKNPEVRVIGAVRVPNNQIPGVRTRNGLDEVAFEWQQMITDDIIEVNEHTAYEKSLQLIRHGLLVGPSAGFAFAAVLGQLEKMRGAATIETLRDKNVVFVAPDSMFAYVREYFEVLEQSYFPQIDDQTDGVSYREATEKIADVGELQVEDVYGDYVERGDELVSQHYQLIDVRSPHEFADHHIPDSHNIPYDQLPTWLAARPDHDHKPIVFICGRGSTSRYAAALAQREGIIAYSMQGGTAEWSDKHLERVRSRYC